MKIRRCVFKQLLAAFASDVVLPQGVCPHLFAQLDSLDVSLDMMAASLTAADSAAHRIDLSFLHRHEMTLASTIKRFFWRGWDFHDGSLSLALEDGRLALTHFDGRLNGGKAEAKGFLQHQPTDAVSYDMSLRFQNVAFPSGAWLGETSHTITQGSADITLAVAGASPDSSLPIVLSSPSGALTFFVRDSYMSGPYTSVIRNILAAQGPAGIIGALAETFFGRDLVHLAAISGDVTIDEGVLHSDNLDVHVGTIGKQGTRLHGWLDAQLPNDVIESRLNIRTPEGGVFANIGIDIIGKLSDPDIRLRGFGEGGILPF